MKFNSSLVSKNINTFVNISFFYLWVDKHKHNNSYACFLTFFFLVKFIQTIFIYSQIILYKSPKNKKCGLTGTKSACQTTIIYKLNIFLSLICMYWLCKIFLHYHPIICCDINKYVRPSLPLLQKPCKWEIVIEW